MSADSDACVPQALTDFVFDLYDSVTLSHITEEQRKFYNTDFADLSSKYFASTPWPSPQTIATECNGDPLFLALYRELTHRHWHSISRVSLRDRLEGWQVYKELLEEILQEEPNFYITPEWAFDILNEFVYQLQGFCQFRTSLYHNAVKYGLLQAGQSLVDVDTSNNNNNNQTLLDNIQTLTNSDRDAWDMEQVLSYLHRLVAIGCAPQQTRPAYQYLGLFASITLSRLECLLGDYTASLEALEPLTKGLVCKRDDGTFGALEIVQSVFLARLSMAYHAGISFFMLRRYKDASRIWGSICAYMQRGFKTGQLRKLPHSDQFNKQYDRMISLLAIVTHICPPAGVVDESVLRTIRDKHGSVLSKMDLVDTTTTTKSSSSDAATSATTQLPQGYMELFQAPKFITASGDNMYAMQMKQFARDMTPQVHCRKLRSFLKLYTSITTSKLAAFHDMDESDFLALLVAYKHRMLQLEAPNKESSSSNVSGSGAVRKSALDIHYYVVGDNVRVDEATKQRRFETYFVNQIAQNGEILSEALAIDTTV